MWTLTYTPLIGDPETRTLEAWGLRCNGLREAGFDVGAVEFETADDFDGAPLFEFTSGGILRLDDVIVFQGRFDEPVRRMAGHVERHVFSLKDLWWHLSRLPYVVERAAVIGITPGTHALGAPEFFTGTTTLEDEITAVISYAAAKGVAVQMGDAAGLDVQPPESRRGDATCAQVLASLRRYAPDAVTQIDHTTTPPTLHFIRRADAAARTLPISGVMDEVRLRAERELQAASVHINYHLIGSDDGAETLQIVQDIYPAESAIGEGAVVVTIEKRGEQRVTQKQQLNTVNLSPNAQWWWELQFPWIRDVEWEGETTIDEGEAVEEDGFPAGLVNQVVGGAVPSWQSAAGGRVRAKAKALNFTYNGRFYAEHDLDIVVEATSLAGGLLTSPPDVTDAETIAVGLAEHYYGAVGALHFSGELRLPEAEITLPRIRPGDVINLSGGLSTERGWDVMRAQVQAVSVDIAAAVTTVRVGPPAHLSLADLQDLMTGMTTQLKIKPLTAGQTVNGQARAANDMAAPGPQSNGEQPHPFYIFGTGRIGLGTVNGSHIPLSGGIEIGSTGAEVDLTDLTAWIYLKATLALTKTESGALISWEWDGGLSDLIIVSSGTPKEDDLTDDTLTTYLLIGQVVDGVPIRPQPVQRSQNLTVCSNGGTTIAATWTSA